jgi:hypothetical protein
MLLDIKDFVDVDIMALKYFFEVGPGGELGESHGGSSGKFVSLLGEVIVDEFEFIVLLFHTRHAYDGAIEHFFEHDDIVFEEFDFGGFFGFFNVGLFLEFVVSDLLFQGVDLVLVHEFGFVEQFEVVVEDRNCVELLFERLVQEEVLFF